MNLLQVSVLFVLFFNFVISISPCSACGDWDLTIVNTSQLCEVIYEMFHILNCGFEIK